jgi:hypothetical protein
MSLVDRVKNILLQPKSEWEVIAGESTTVGGLFTGYAAILALLPVVGGIVAMGLLGISAGGMGGLGGAGLSIGLSAVVAMTVIGYVVGLAVLWLMSFIVNAVSPSFNGKSEMVQATKLMTYSSTPNWVVGLVSPFIPIVGSLLGIGAIAYAVYLIYLGLKPVLGVPQEKVAGFTVVIVLIYIVLSLVVGGIIAATLFSTFFGGAMMAGAMAGA